MLESKANIWITADSEALCQDLQCCENPSELLSPGSLLAGQCDSDPHANHTGLHLPGSIPCQSLLCKAAGICSESPPGSGKSWWQHTGSSLGAPSSPAGLCHPWTSICSSATAFPKDQLEETSWGWPQSHLGWEEPPAARGSSRTDGAIYTGNKRDNIKSCYFLHFWAQSPAGGQTSTSQWGSTTEFRLWGGCQSLPLDLTLAESTESQPWRFLHITKDNVKFVCHKPHSAPGLEEQLKGGAENQTQGAKSTSSN